MTDVFECGFCDHQCSDKQEAFHHLANEHRYDMAQLWESGKRERDEADQ